MGDQSLYAFVTSCIYVLKRVSYPDLISFLVSETSTDRTRPQRKVEPKMIYITFQFEDIVKTRPTKSKGKI